MRGLTKWLIRISVFMVCSGIPGQEIEQTSLLQMRMEPIVRYIGSIPSIDPPEDIRILQDAYGNAYTFLVTNGDLRILRTDLEGNSGTFLLEGITTPITQIISSDFCSIGLTQYVAYRGMIGDSEIIHLIGLEYNGDLHYFSVPDLYMSGSISAFTLLASNDGSAMLFILQDGMLHRISNLGFSENAPESIVIQSGINGNSEIQGYEVASNLKKAYQAGWIQTVEDDFSRYELFITSASGVVSWETIEISFPDAILRLGMTKDGEVNYHLFAGDTFIEYAVKEGSIVLTECVVLPSPVLDYYYPIGYGDVHGFIVTEYDAIQEVYQLRSGLDGVSRFIDASEIDVIGGFIFLPQDCVAVLYKSHGVWGAAIGNGDHGVGNTVPLEDLPQASELFFIAPQGTPRVYFYTAQEHILVYSFNGNDFIREPDLQLPSSIAQAGIRWSNTPEAHPFFRDTLIIPIRTGSGLFFLYAFPDMHAISFIEGSRFGYSLNINWGAYLAAYTNGSLDLYRLEE